jgi:pSer/pThr/pTyr-binding forkhead associated (FHA) protein
MRVCPHCGKETRADDRYCLHCGQRLDGEPDGNAPPLIVAASGGGWTVARETQASAHDGAPAKGGPSHPLPASATAAAAARGGAPVPKRQPEVKARLVLQPRAGTHESAREFWLDGSEVAIGRAPNCQVVLADDQLASRRHALLRYVGDHYTIVDLGSSNGTYVNGVETHGTTPLHLSDGDRITVGEHELLYTTATAPDAAARPTSVTTDGLPVPVPPPWPPPPSASEATRETELRLPAVSSPTHATPAPAQEPDAVPTVVAAMAGGSGMGDIEQIQAQLVEASAALARRVEAAERETERLRAALAELGQRAADALATLGATNTGSSGLDDLIQVARQAADNPRHLDHVTALAQRAGDLARVLESEQGLTRALEELRDRAAEHGNG